MKDDIPTLVRQHEKRHDAHDKGFIDVYAAMKLKVPRWVFIGAIVLFLSVLGVQHKTLNHVATTVNSIDKKVAVLYAIENHPPLKKTSLTGPELWISKR